MKEDHEIPQWLRWARELHQLGETGVFYAGNEFERQRFERLIAISAEMLKDHVDEPEEKILAALNAQPGYITPKVDVRGAVFEEDRILMVKEITDGNWSLPGGWADVNDAPSDTVEREVREETGLTVHARKLIGVYEANHDREPVNVFHCYKLLFLCDRISGSLQPSYETPQVRYYGLNELPQLSIYRTQERYIQEAYRHYQDPTLATVFD